MHEFTSITKYNITGRGIAYSISKDQIPDGMFDPCDLTGETVLIDGVQHLVRGVETHAIMRSQTNPYRHNFGLLVAEQ